MGISVIIVFGAFLLLLPFAPKIKPLKKLILGYTEKDSDGFTAPSQKSPVTVGMQGKSLTPLRPAGKATIGDAVIDVVTEGDFIPYNTAIRVIEVEGARIVVTQEGNNGEKRA